jgi:TRAP transporter 4TM/12TM fusion protein
MAENGSRPTITVLAVMLCLFTVAEVNYPFLGPQAQLAIFATLGLTICFVIYPVHERLKNYRALRLLDTLLIALTVGCGTFVVMQTEPFFEKLWIGGQSLGNRAGQESTIDVIVGVVGLLLVLEATRRSIGWALPLLALTFLAFARFGPILPDWLFPHRGYGLERIVSQTFLHSQGVFGVALRVMFTYVFLFVVFGAVLQATGATQFIIDFAQRVFGTAPGGPAKVAVLSSGLMGSLSGSAVANTATTGTFTIPLMRSSGFRPEVAGGVEAAASSGGALVPPVMGAGAYMMLEIINPPVTYLQIIRAALIPGILYYLSLFLIVHFTAKRIGAQRSEKPAKRVALFEYEGLVFLAGFSGLILLLVAGYTVFRAVSLALLIVLVVAAFKARTRVDRKKLLDALTRAGRDAVPLVSAAACVGIVIGVVTLTGVGTKLPTAILSLAQGNLLSALVLIMVSSIILGMGLPSAVCYLLLATLVGPVLSDLGVVPLGAHLFIFYFGMMSMVTPPVALAAYTAASIARSGIMKTALAAFRFALVGFTLPYMFVLRPALLMLDSGGETAAPVQILSATVLAVLGILPLAACIAGYMFARLAWVSRALLFTAAILLLLPGSELTGGQASNVVIDTLGILIFAGVAVASWRTRRGARVLESA